MATAPGAPGLDPTWSSSNKEMVGCSLGSSRLWFTIGGGIINEVYYPRVDIPQIRDLGFIVADPGVATHAPGVLLASFVPMLLISLGYKYLNKADPDSGTTFAWTTRAFGPTFGWLNGWAIFLADLLVMASLGYIAATYTYLLFEWHYGETHVWVALVGCILWIWLMTWICHRGIELSARIQQILLGFELAMLMIFAIAFEMPLIFVLLNLAGVLTHERFRKWRRGIIFLVFLFAATFTPSPDPLSMLLLAVPCLVLVEAAEGFAWIHDRRKARRVGSLAYPGLTDEEVAAYGLEQPVSEHTP